jgi:hypothetical protein
MRRRGKPGRVLRIIQIEPDNVAGRVDLPSLNFGFNPQ